MPIYAANAVVDKQMAHEACWASICVAVMATISSTKAVTPTNLFNRWRVATNKSPQDPKKVLETEFNVKCDEVKFGSPVSDVGELTTRAAEIERLVTESLKNQIPVICGLTTYDNAKLGTIQKVDWRHATLAYKCDDASHTCWIQDPSPHGANVSLADRQIYFIDMAGGFDYMDQADFGPETKKTLGISQGVLLARVYRLVIPRK